VLSVLVHEGDTVRAGQTLVRLDDSLARADVDRTQATIAAAQHQVELAKTQSEFTASTLARYRILRDSKSVSPQEFDEVDRRAQAAAAQLESARSQLDAARAEGAGAHAMAGYSIIAAPFAGIVTARHVDPGALATPGTPLVEMERGGALQLQISIDESLLRNLKIGDAIDANVPSAASQPLRGRVAEIVPAADPASHTFMVKIELLTSSSLRSGMYGTASIQGSARPALLIPQAAVLAHGSLNSAWVLDSNRIASIRYITLGNRVGQNVEVLSGLSSGETVVLSAGDRELVGSRIEVRP
jgi:RND family efflux transporter MFP subunit